MMADPKPVSRALAARMPIARTRKPKSQRKFKTPRCIKRGCVRPQIIDEMCRSHAKREMDRLWSVEVRAAGVCEAAGWVESADARPVACGGVLQAAHGFPRTYLKTRWVPLNGFCICAGHHRWFTTKPLHWTAFMIERLGEHPYEEMRLMALGRTNEPRSTRP